MLLLQRLCRRQLSRAVQENLMLDLRRTQPAFAVPASNVRVLSQPAEFYNLLLVCRVSPVVSVASFNLRI